jgi:uncharacterized protein
MKFNLFQYAPVWYKLIVTVFVSLSSLLFFYLLALVLAIPVFNVDIKELSDFAIKGATNFNNTAFLKYLQFFQAIGSFLVPSFILAFLFSGSVLSYLAINKSPSSFTMFLVILSVIVALPLINYSGYLNSKLELPEYMGGIERKMIELEEEASRLIKSMLSATTITGLMINLLLIAVLPAIGEELIFRGVVQRLFIEWTKNAHLGIIITSFLFSFLHLQFFGFLPRFLLGVYFGYLFVWSGSIWIPVIAHFVNNATIVFFYHFFVKEGEKPAIDEIGISNDHVFLLIAGAFLFTVLTVSVFNYEKMRFRMRN